MKILHVLADSDPAKGGVIEGVLQLGEAYRRLGHEQHLLTLDDPRDPWVGSTASPIFPLGKPGATKRFYPARAIAWLRAHAEQYDAIVVDGLWNAATLAAARVLPQSGVPYAVFPHGMLDPWFRELQPAKEWVKRQLFRVNEGPLLRGAKAVLFTTERERELARATWPGWQGMREQVVGFGTGEPPSTTNAEILDFRSGVVGLADARYLLFLSRIHPKKGCELLLEGFANAHQGERTHLVIAGPGAPDYLARLHRLSDNLGISSKVHWPGMLQSGVKWAALNGCEAMVLTSYQENFGVVVAEALACRKPVLISDQVNIHDAVAQARAGFICETTAASVADKLCLLKNLTARERGEMGLRGRELYERGFSMDEVARRVLVALCDEPIG